ncbi:Tom37 C-terminal domain-containing protein [Umbelopsis sp. AD052]|nr:Tom37 C-terminal domain-containing protein [Umbelopsis sp. AD052]
MALQLYVWGPALDVPSIDPSCVAVEAYLRATNANFTVVYANDPQLSPTGQLPLLKDGPVWVAGASRILSHLSKKGHDGNASLSAEQVADSLAYISLIEEKLYDCMLFTWYADQTNFVKTIRPTYAKLLPFPTRYFVPIRLRNNAKARLEKYEVEIKDDDDSQLATSETDDLKKLMETGWHHMYTLARDTYKVLDAKLGEKDYFFGDKPSTLDCLAFGYLSLHMYPMLPHHRLRIILTTEYPRLSLFCDRFKKAYFTEPLPQSESATEIPTLWKSFTNSPVEFFSSIKSNIIGQSGEEKKEEKKSDAQLDFERKRIWSIAGAVTLFLGYIIMNGIVSIELGDDSGDYEEGEYYEQEEEDFSDDE